MKVQDNGETIECRAMRDGINIVEVDCNCLPSSHCA